MSAPPSCSLSQRFHADGLHSIFRLLSLPDVLPALLSCHAWLDAGLKERCRGVTFDAGKAGLLPSLRSSRLRTHITTLDRAHLSSRSDWQVFRSLASLTAVSTGASVNGLGQQWKDLPTGFSSPEMIQRAAGIFPPRLESLSLTLDGSSGIFNPLKQSLIRVLGLFDSLTSLDLSCRPSVELDLSPLLRCSRLRELILRDLILGPQSMAVIKRMPALEHLGLRQSDVGTLTLLCIPPLSVRPLRRIDLIGENPRLSDRTAAEIRAFASLPGIESIGPCGLELDALPLLRTMPALSTAQLRLCMQNVPFASFSLAVADLIACRSLTSLQLNRFTVDSPGLRILAAGLPALRSFALVESVVAARLDALHAMLQLESVSLIVSYEDDRGMPLDKIAPLASSPALRSLVLSLPLEPIPDARGWTLAVSALFSERVRIEFRQIDYRSSNEWREWEK